eukprot:1138883-Pelagomonas_calceolata.AAC.4
MNIGPALPALNSMKMRESIENQALSTKNFYALFGSQTLKDEPNLSIPATDLEFDNLERQRFDKADSNNTWKQTRDTELRNKVTVDVNPTNPQADIIETGRCEFWIANVNQSPVAQQAPPQSRGH